MTDTVPDLPLPQDAADTPPQLPVAHGHVTESDTMQTEPAALGLRESDRRFLTVMAVVFLVLMTLHVLRSWWSTQPLIEVRRLESRELEFQIDINQSTWVEWMQLPGIGETMARQIVADREEHGPFTSVEDVGRVKGIGPVRLREMRPHLRVQPSEQASPAK